MPAGYSLKWTGDFENQQRATKRLAQVVPISIAIIFIILFIFFSNARDAGLVLLNVPFAAVGGIVALLITGFNFSISAGIGFIALFGICIQNGVIMISDIKANLKLGSPFARCYQRRSPFTHPSRDYDGGYGSYRPDAGGYEPWHRFGITASAGDCHYRRIDRSDLLRLVYLSADCGSGIRTNAV